MEPLEIETMGKVSRLTGPRLELTKAAWASRRQGKLEAGRRLLPPQQSLSLAVRAECRLARFRLQIFSRYRYV